MKLPQFIFFDTPALPGAGFVLCTDQPFFIAKVFKFYDVEKLAAFVQEKKLSDWNVVSVKDYNILLIYSTNLMKHFSPSKSAVLKTLHEMATFYLEEKIKTHAAAYTKFKR